MVENYDFQQIECVVVYVVCSTFMYVHILAIEEILPDFKTISRTHLVVLALVVKLIFSLQ